MDKLPNDSLDQMLTMISSFVQDNRMEYAQRVYEICSAPLMSRIYELELALHKIANPIKAFQEQAEKEGAKLDGQAAIALSKDANYLQSIAQNALK